jgi:putative ABC transport system permease protein
MTVRGQFRLGAPKGHVFRLLISEGLKVLIAGSILGLLGAAALTRFLDSQLYGVAPTDPWTYLIVTALLAFLTVPACSVAARRATRINPIAALRHE